MALPESLRGRLTLPAVAAPQFLVSGPDLVVETCKAGLLGTFPALNQRSNEGFSDWLDEIRERLGNTPAPYGVNLIVHKSNTRLDEDLATVVKHRVPLVITSLGAVSELVQAVQSYGGMVFHDVINLRHAAKAAEAGVDGLIAVTAGAGGHAGLLNPFAFLTELRAIFEGTLLLAGSLSTGRHIAAARVAGADLAYLGTRFIATTESMASEEYKQMILNSSAKDIVYTDAISGVKGSFMRASLENAGLDPENLPEKKAMNVGSHEKRAWKNIWSAGQGVGAIRDIPTTAELCARLTAEYRAALDEAATY
ncbi:NAD(P)H-dependent flavin oxidoreductase [Plastoroseomonas arctica]|uniref:Nitronate monooxygenase n=1 Tax=Plastoroseomonas arctica TaxID=1509237 RepID=A0AAF1K4I7_9PROT|nr:nitronate monooxygenase [Plastoroseomonas arctica]MBR0656034.1 nitronate monooxygenase [Plastoroseomonas arctica]